MDDTSKKKLDEITAKEPAALTEGDIVFLKARRSYLTADQLTRYAEVLGQSDEEEEKALNEMTRAELEDVAKELGLDPDEYAKKADLIAAIEEKQSE